MRHYLRGSAAFVILLLLAPACSDSPTESMLKSGNEGVGTLAATPTPPDPGMDFPYQDPSQVDRFYCFGLFPWDVAGLEIHGGTDIVPYYDPAATDIQEVPLIAVADGRVARIIESTSGAGAPAITVVQELNPYWFATYTIEPQTLDPAQFALQLKAVKVKEGKQVKRGKKLADLIVATVMPGSYPHLHFGFFYKNPAESLDYLQEHFLEVLRSDGTNLPPLSGPGSPWEPADLGIPTTLYCPYVYFNAAARSVVDSRPTLAANGDLCTSLCAYGSTDGGCGSATAS